MKKWRNAENKVPEVYDTYDCYGNEYAESATVITDAGVGVYRCEKGKSKGGEWYLLDSDPKYNCRSPRKVAYWMEVPKCLRMSENE